MLRPCLRRALLTCRTWIIAVDEVASKEGMSAALDPEMNNVVNDEVNKF
jgi:hypothetical protein